MYKLCKTDQSASRQRQLEQGLLHIMSFKSYEDISVSDLCDSLKIPRKSFYRYFSSKEGAFHALIDHTMMEYESFNMVYSNGESRTLERELEQFFLFWFQHRQLLEVLFRNNLAGVLIERAVAHALAEPVMPKRFLPQDSVEMQKYITMFGVCGLLSMVMNWHHDNYRLSAGQMAKIAARMIGQPLFPDADKLM